MTTFLHDFVLTFVPLFIVIDPFGNLPFLLQAQFDKNKFESRKIVHLAVITASVVGLVFLFFGQFILNIMGIKIPEFTIAGGIILLVLSIRYMVTGHMVVVIPEEMVAVVPIGTPLTVGPGTIATLLILAGLYPIYTVLIAFIVNMILTWIIFLLSEKIAGFLGRGGLIAISRIFALILAAIAVSMVISGLRTMGIIAA